MLHMLKHSYFMNKILKTMNKKDNKNLYTNVLYINVLYTIKFHKTCSYYNVD